MIEIKTNKGQTSKLVLHGDLAEISTDLLVVVRSVYDALYDGDPEVAKKFKHLTKYMIENEESIFEPWAGGGNDED